MRRRMLFGACALMVVGCGDSGGRDDATTVTTVTTVTTPATSVDADSSAPTSGAPTTTDPSTGSAGETGTGSASEPVVSSGSSGGPSFDLGTVPDMGGPPQPLPQLWYSVEDLLVYIELERDTGAVAQLVTSTIKPNPSLAGPVNSCGLTMLPDGSLLGSRGIAGNTRMFHVPDPPTVASDIDVTILGALPGKLYVEALYTDCDGRVYLIDTGPDGSSNVGNRLLRFTGDYLAKDFAYEVITDLQVAVSADIDDMAPGIDATGKVIDNPGFGMDSGSVYMLDYTDGSGTMLGMAGTYGIHALGGQLFDDKKSRLYVLDIDANVHEADPKTLALSPVLATGPALMSGNKAGNTGFAGPLTACRTGFPQG
jgi:hypothetical protein